MQALRSAMVWRPMHSSSELRSAAFDIELDGASATLDDLFARFEARDRVGAVVRDPVGAVGASTLLLAAVTRFYDFQRAMGGEFFIYPDYFLFHVDRRLGDHGMLDIWPSHKEVVVADDPEHLLEAINDRGITRLLVPDGRPADPRLQRQTLASAEGRIASALAYSPTGRVADADVRIAANDVTESYVNAVLDPDGTGEVAAPYGDNVDEVGAELRRQIRSKRATLLEDGRPVETYRRLGLGEALALLSANGAD